MHIHIFRLDYLKCCSSLDDGEDGVLLLLLSFTAGESSNIGRQSVGKNRIWPLTIVVRKGRWKRRPPGSNLLTWISRRWCLVAVGGDRTGVLPVASRDLLPSFRVEGRVGAGTARGGRGRARRSQHSRVRRRACFLRIQGQWQMQDGGVKIIEIMICMKI